MKILLFKYKATPVRDNYKKSYAEARAIFIFNFLQYSKFQCFLFFKFFESEEDLKIMSKSLRFIIYQGDLSSVILKEYFIKIIYCIKMVTRNRSVSIFHKVNRRLKITFLTHWLQPKY